MSKPLTTPEIDTYMLLLQSLKFLMIENYDVLKRNGAGFLVHEQKAHLTKLIKLFEVDIRRIYDKVDKADPDNVDNNMLLYYHTIDFIRLAFETAGNVSRQMGKVDGIPVVMEVLQLAKEGKLLVTDAEPIAQ